MCFAGTVVPDDVILHRGLIFVNNNLTINDKLFAFKIIFVSAYVLVKTGRSDLCNIVTNALPKGLHKKSAAIEADSINNYLAEIIRPNEATYP